MRSKPDDGTGNKTSVFKSVSVSNHSDSIRSEHDYYATDPLAAPWLLKLEPDLSPHICECA